MYQEPKEEACELCEVNVPYGESLCERCSDNVIRYDEKTEKYLLKNGQYVDPNHHVIGVDFQIN